MGTALRAVGNGMRVLMLQFLKGSWHYGELDSTKAFGENFVLRQMGRGFVKIGGAETDPEDIRLVEEAWEEARQAILSGEWDMVILDEINYAISYGMLDPAKVVETLRRARKWSTSSSPAATPIRRSSPSPTPSPKCAK
jgi:cob(I)alamin adenosyltransferase